MQLTPGDLARFGFEHGGQDAEGHPVLRGLAFERRCSPERALADSWTKLVFQCNARAGGLAMDAVLAHVRQPRGDDEVMADDA